MRHYLKALIISSIAFFGAYQLIPTIILGPGLNNLAIVIASLLIVSLFIRPIFSLILLPINFLTLGSVSLILNAILVYGLTIYLQGFTIKAFDFKGADVNGFILPAYHFNQLATIILVALVITFIQKVLHIIFE